MSAASLENDYKSLMRRTAQAVYVVTSRTKDGLPIGVTVSSFTSISLQPILVMIAISKKIFAHDALISSATFIVNVLGEDQIYISNQFAGKALDPQKKFESVPVHFHNDEPSPIIDGILGWLQCSRHSNIDAGDHTIILGEVRRATINYDKLPLIYCQGKYTTTTRSIAIPLGGDSFEWPV